jgi:hypothetical protein
MSDFSPRSPIFEIDEQENKRRKSGAMVPPPVRTRLPAELASRLSTGAMPAETPALARVATGIAAVDALTGGGLPRGRLVEITGAPSSGRTSLSHALLGAATRAGERVAVVDAADAFDPASAAAAGVALDRVLWARPTRHREALRCAERLVEARGFGVVLIDLDRVRAEPRRRPDEDANALWLRMTRSARASGTAVVLLASRARLGAFAALTLEARTAGARFAPEPAWLEALDTRWTTLRSRIGRSADDARVAWRFSAE